ncbi:potassium channel skor [Pycnococcus provasolii]
MQSTGLRLRLRLRRFLITSLTTPAWNSLHDDDNKDSEEKKEKVHETRSRRYHQLKKLRRVRFNLAGEEKRRGERYLELRVFEKLEFVEKTYGGDWSAVVVFMCILETFLLPERLALDYDAATTRGLEFILTVIVDCVFGVNILLTLVHLTWRRAERLHIDSMSIRQQNKLLSSKLLSADDAAAAAAAAAATTTAHSSSRTKSRQVLKKQREVTIAVARESSSKQTLSDNSVDAIHRYLTGRFLLDVGAILLMWIDAYYPTYWWVRLAANAPRAIRIHGLVTFFREQEMNLRVDVRKLAVIKFILLIIGCAHWVGCIFFYLSRLSKFSATRTLMTWVAQWEIQGGVAGYDAELSPKWESYLLILYKGFNGLTNLGYENVVPQRYDEMIFSVLTIYVHVILDSYILGTLFHYVVKKDRAAEEFRKKLTEVHKWSRSQNLPEELESSLVSHYEFQFSKKREDDSKVMKMLPLPIKLKVASHNYGRFVQRNKYLFKRCTTQFIEQFQLRLVEEYLMPGETLAHEKDMARELVFLASGSLEFHRDGQFVRVLRAESEMPNAVGDLSFLMSVPHPYTVTARTTSDCTIVLMRKSAFEDVIMNYPEHMDIMLSNVLEAQVGLSKSGADLESPALINRGFGGDEDDEEHSYLRSYIQQALQRRNNEALSAMTFAASEGDVETVQSLIHQGLPIDAYDYDNRTTLHLACAEGKDKVVELLVNEGADVSVKDRWGQTPMQDAINNKFEQIVDILAKNGASVAYADPSGPLCTAAAESDLDGLGTLLDNGVNPDAADYDDRCALHLASSNGNLQVVEYLLRRGANVNARDRWTGSPLLDAITHGHEICAKLLYANGGKMNMDEAANRLCSAASEGDLEVLRLLVENGVPVDEGDYDQRCALHLAAAEGQLLAVNFLISNGAQVNVKDRWGGTPLEDALRGDYLSVAVLLQKEGAELGSGDPAILEKLSTAPTVKMVKQEVVILFKRMRKFGGDYVSADVESSSRIAIDCTMMIIPLVPEMRVEIFQVEEQIATVEEKFGKFKSHLEKWTKHLNGSSSANRRSGSERRSKKSRRSASRGGGDAAAHVQVDLDFDAKHWNHLILQLAKYESQLRLFLLQVEDNPVDISPQDWLHKALNTLQLHAPREKTRQMRILTNSIGELLVDREFRNTVSVYMRTHGANKNISPALKQQQAVPTGDSKQSKFTHPVEMVYQISGALDYVFDAIKNEGKSSATFTPLKDAKAEADTVPNEFITAEHYESVAAVVERMPGLKRVNYWLNAELQNGPMQKARFFHLIISHWVHENNDEEQAESDEESAGDTRSHFTNTGGLNFSELFYERESVDLDREDVMDDDLMELAYELDEAATIPSQHSLEIAASVPHIPNGNAGDEHKSKNSDRSSSSERKIALIRQSRSFLFRTSCIPPWMVSLMMDVKTRLTVFWARMRYGMQLSEERLDEIVAAFNEIDIDHTGFIEAWEVRELVKRMYHSTELKVEQEKMVFDLIDALDGNGDGLVSISEFVSTMVHSKGGTEIAGLLDADNILRFASKSSRLSLPQDAPWYIVDPQSKNMKRWEAFIRLCCYFFFIDVPLRIAFQTQQELGIFYTIVSQTLDAMLLVDMVLKCFTAYINKNSVVVVKVEKIVGHYLANGFVIDLIAAFPLDLLVYAASSKNPQYDFMAWLRIFKLLRLHRLIRYHKQREKNMNADSFLGIVSGLLPLFLGFSHILACVLYYIARLQKDSSTWLKHYEGLGYESVLNDGGILSRYVVSYYWVSASVSTNGLVGEMEPSNWYEISFTILVMLVNVTLYAYVLGEVSNAVIKQDEELVRTRQNMSSIVSFIKAKNLPPNLANEIHQLSDGADGGGGATGTGGSSSLDSNAMSTGQTIFSQLSHSLQVQVARHVSRPLLRNVALFQGCSEVFLDALSVVLKETRFPPDTVLYYVNEVPRELHIVSSGSIEIFAEVENAQGEMSEIVTDIKSKSEMVGEFAFLFAMRHQTSARSARSMNTTTYAITRSDSSALFKLYQDEEDQLTKNVLLSMTQNGNTPRSATTATTASSYMSKSSTGSLNSSKTGSQTSATSAIDDSNEVKKVLNEAKDKKKNKKVVQFVTAAAGGHLDEVKRLLDSKDVEVDDGDYDKRTAIHLAASNGHLHIVRALLDLGANWNVQDRYGGTPLDDAIRHEHDHVVTFLQQRGAVMDLEDAGNKLCDCAARGDLAALKRFVESGVDPNAADYDKRTALHLAASNNRADVVQYLVSLKKINVNPEDRWEGTPLMDSIRHKHSEIQQILRKAGAHVGSADIATQLCDVAAKNSLDMLRTYGENGINLNSGDYDMRTALHLAASNDMLESASWLLQHHTVDSSPVDRLGGTPLDDAHRHNNSVMVALLERHRALRGSDEEIKEKHRAQNARLKVQLVERNKGKLAEIVANKPERLMLNKISKLSSVIAEGLGKLDGDFLRLQRGLKKVIDANIVYYDALDTDGAWMPTDSHGDAVVEAEMNRNSAVNYVRETIAYMRETFQATDKAFIELLSLVRPVRRLAQLISPPFLGDLEKAHAAIAAFHSALEIFVRTGEKSAFHSEVMEKAMRHESRVAARRKQKQSSLSTPSKPDHNRKSGGGMVRLASELSFLSTTESL